MMPSKDALAANLKKDPSLSDEELIEHMRDANVKTKSNVDEIKRLLCKERAGEPES